MSRRNVLLLFAVAGLALSSLGGCAASKVCRCEVTACSGGGKGLAVYYSDVFEGNRTASGEVYYREEMTAAHRTLPFGTTVRVTRLSNGRSVEVRINDRGPFGDNRRVIDLSWAAAKELRMLREGVVPVRVEVLTVPERSATRRRRRRSREG